MNIAFLLEMGWKSALIAVLGLVLASMIAGVLLAMAPLYFSSYVLGLRVPEVSLTVENIADFISAYIIGNLLQMAFRFWALRRYAFPEDMRDAPDQESIPDDETRTSAER